MSIKFHELELIQQKFVKYETDYLAKEMTSLNELGQLKIDLETVKFQQQHNVDQQRNMSYQCLKLNEDIQQTAKKSMEQMGEIQEKIAEYIKDQYTQFIDLRNRFNEINEKFQFVESDIKNQNELSTYFQQEFESFKQLKDNLKMKIDNMTHELEQKIQKSQFQESFDQLEYNRIQDLEAQKHFQQEQNRYFDKQIHELLDKVDDSLTNSNLLKKHFRELEEQSTLHQTENRNRMSMFTKTVLELQILLKESQEDIKSTIKEINENYSMQINNHQTHTRNQILRLQQDQDSFKDKITKVFTEELQKEKKKITKNIQEEIETISQKIFQSQIDSKLSSISKPTQSKEVQVDLEIKIESNQQSPIKNQNQNQTFDQIDISIPNLSQFNQANTQSKRRNTTTVVQPQINYNVIQDMIEKTLFELINETLASSQVLKDQINNYLASNQQDREKEIDQLIQTRLKSQQQSFNRMYQQIEKSDILDPIDELKAEIQILNEMRNEMEHKLQQLSIEFKQLINRIEKQSAQVLKLKSDLVNDIDYVNGQLRVLIKEKENNQTKNHQFINCLSCTSETLYVIMAILLQQNESKYQKIQNITDGVICEINSGNDQKKIIFRNVKFDVGELVLKQFYNQMEVWGDNELQKSYRMRDNYVQTIKNSVPVTTTELSKTFGEFQRSFYEPTLSGRNSKQGSRKSTFRARSSKVTVHKLLKQQGLSDSCSR